MDLGIEEEINDVIKKHPKVYFNHRYEPAVPRYALPEIITNFFVRLGVEEKEAELMAAPYIREIPVPELLIEVTPGTLLRFLWSRYAQGKEKRLPTFLLHDYRQRQSEESGPLGQSPSRTPTARPPKSSTLVAKSSGIQRLEPQLVSHGLLVPSAPTTTTGVEDNRGPTQWGPRSSDGGSSPEEQLGPGPVALPVPLSEDSTGRSPEGDEHDNNAKNEEMLTRKSKRRQGLLQRVPRVFRTRPRESFKVDGSKLSLSRSLSHSPPFSHTSGYSADLSEDQGSTPPGTANEFGERNGFFKTERDTSVRPDGVSDVLPHTPAILGLHNTYSDSDANIHMHPSPSLTKLNLKDDIPRPNLRGKCAKCTQSPPLRGDSIPNLSEHIHNIRGPLLAGGFCDIYIGELRREAQSGAAEQVAMKMLRVFGTGVHVTKSKKKFRREIDLWLCLRHTHVLRFYGTFEMENRLFMVSPWAQGGNLLEYLRRNPTANRGKIIWQTSSALQYLHSGQDAPQVVHGDLKADNVLISATGDALLCDFGLSRHIHEAMSTTSSTCAGGHIRFMAPELIVAPKGACRPTRTTPASDVFAFASLMLQIYTEMLPFFELSEVQALFKIANGELPSRPSGRTELERGLNDCVWDMMCDCWQFEAERRPTMDELTCRTILLV